MKRLGVSLIETLVLIAVVGLLAAVALPMLARAHEVEARNTCMSNLKEMGVVLNMFAQENGGYYPRMHADQPFGTSGAAVGCDAASLQDQPAFAPDMNALYPEYVTDPSILLCPSDKYERKNPLMIVEDDGSGDCKYPGLITRGDQSYTYFGYTFDQVDEDSPRLPYVDLASGQLVAVMKIFRSVVGNQNPADDVVLNEDIELADLGLDGLNVGNRGGDTIYRLRIGMENVHLFDKKDVFAAYSTPYLPVMWDTVRMESTADGVNAHHFGFGCNVLYLDGHVDFTRFAEQFPGTTRFAQLSTLM